jgi:hypothetical protein
VTCRPWPVGPGACGWLVREDAATTIAMAATKKRELLGTIPLLPLAPVAGILPGQLRPLR